MTSFTISVQLKGAIRRDDDAGVFVSFCPALKIYSQGETKKEAKEALTSAVRLFIDGCLDRGILDRMLRELGFSPSPVGMSVSPRALADEFIKIEKAKYDEAFEFDVPFYLVAQNQQAQCRL